MIPASIKRLDYRPIPKIRDEIRAFLVVRNEALRLPATLRHHRAIGVQSFFVFDDPRSRRAAGARRRQGQGLEPTGPPDFQSLHQQASDFRPALHCEMMACCCQR